MNHLTMEEIDALIELGERVVQHPGTPTAALLSAAFRKLEAERAFLLLREAMKDHPGFHPCSSSTCTELIPVLLPFCHEHLNRLPATFRRDIWVQTDALRQARTIFRMDPSEEHAAGVKLETEAYEAAVYRAVNYLTNSGLA